MVRGILGVDSALLSGMAIFIFAGSGAIAVLLLSHLEPTHTLRLGSGALLGGVLIVMSAVLMHSPLLFFVGSILAGAGFGTGFQGAVRSVLATADANERGGLVSVIFVIAYLAMGLPALGAGYLLAHGGALAGTVREFAGLVVVLAGLALAGGMGRSALPAPRIETKVFTQPSHCKE